MAKKKQPKHGPPCDKYHGPLLPHCNAYHGPGLPPRPHAPFADCPACDGHRDPSKGDDESRLCHDCRSVAGCLGELDLAIRLAGDDTSCRVDEKHWREVRTVLIKRLGNKPDIVLLDILKQDIARRSGVDHNQVMQTPLPDLAKHARKVEPPAEEFRPTPEDITILRVLSEQTAGIAQDKIELLSMDSSRPDLMTVSRRTISERSPVLHAYGLVAHPTGRNRLESITEKGRNLLEKS